MVRNFIKFDTLPKKIIGILIFANVALLSLYGYFIDRSVLHIVERKDIERDIAILNTTLSSLEMDFVKAEHGITPELAYSHGFVEAKDVDFVSRQTNVAALTIYNER